MKCRSYCGQGLLTKWESVTKVVKSNTRNKFYPNIYLFEIKPICDLEDAHIEYWRMPSKKIICTLTI